MPILRTLSETQAAVISDDAFGEWLLIAPMMKGRKDERRTEARVFGVLRTGHGTSENMAGGIGSRWQVQIAGGKAEAHIDLAKYPDLYVRENDVLRALDRRGQPWFTVERPDDRGAPRLVLHLSEK